MVKSKGLRGWGRGLRRAVGEWFTSKEPKELAYHAVKYQSRNGWSNRDLLRLSHPKAKPGTDTATILHWIAKGWEGVGDLPHERDALKIIWAFERAKVVADKHEMAKLIADYNLPRECVPTKLLNEPVVWEALLAKMPMGALVRNLGNLTKHGLLSPLSEGERKVVGMLKDLYAIKKAKLHPLSLLTALKTYSQGRGDKGSGQWAPTPNVVAALDESFYLAFGAVEPAGKRFLLGVDVSGSMCSPIISGSPLSPREAAMALALVTINVEPWTFTGAFSAGFRPLPFNKQTRLMEAVSVTRGMSFDRTDCALPMMYAMATKTEVDTFVVLTDNETWSGQIHPFQALEKYRQATGIPAKLAVIGMTATNFTIANPEDAGMLDCVGFDTATPSILADFARE